MKELDYRIPLPLHFNSTTTYIPTALMSCSHVYLCVDRRLRRPLEVPYMGPYKVLAQSPQCFTIALPSGSFAVVSIDHLKPAATPSNTSPSSTVSSSPNSPNLSPPTQFLLSSPSLSQPVANPSTPSSSCSPSPSSSATSFGRNDPSGGLRGLIPSPLSSCT